MNSYIYIRIHESYNNYNLCKLGSTGNIPERNDVYKTSEIKKGKFISVYEIFKPIKIIIIENLLKTKLELYNLKINAGNEFFDKIIIDKIEEIFINHNIQYKKLTEDEINSLIRKHRIKKLFNNIDKKKLINLLKQNKIKPYEYQQICINKFIDKIKNNNILKLIWSCGLGKTLQSLFICDKMKYKNICIGVPSINLMEQFKNEILLIFKNVDILFIGGNDLNKTKDKQKIKDFLKSNNKIKFIITTYTSCNVLVNKKIKFDFKIGDECHHLVNVKNNDTGYIEFHNIKSNKTLFMTATEKNINIVENKIIYTMNDEEKFGLLIDEKTVKWAIENKKITDYNLLIVGNTVNEIEYIIQKLELKIDNIELFISSFIALKSLENYNDLSHILICCNNIKNSDIINNYINLLLDKKVFKIKKKEIYRKSIHSKLNVDLKSNNDNNEINKFIKSKYGIISSVYIFSEGFNLPELNGVIFAENMFSDIRILQTSLRPNRLLKSKPDKISYIILPYIENNDNSYDKIRMIICKLRNSDDNIEQKIKYVELKNNNQNNNEKINLNIDYSFNENQTYLNKIKLKLKKSKALTFGISEEQLEYNYTKEINKLLNIQDKNDYFKTKIKNKHDNYINDPIRYFGSSNVWTNWYDFLSIDTTNFIDKKYKWIKYCQKYNLNNIDEYLKEYPKHNCLMKYPEDYYKNFSNINDELFCNKKRRNVNP